MVTILAQKNNLKKIPLSPGVYLFKNINKNVVYVGKAKALKNRLSSYWALSLTQKTSLMMSEAYWVSYITVGSEFEALLLESSLVKKHRPKYNIELKDDKSPLYIGITNEPYPRVLTFRQTQLQSVKLKEVYGPFVNGRAARSVLKRIRKVIPFSTHRPTTRTCIYSEIGLCSPCPSMIEKTKDKETKLKLKRKYQRNVRKIQRLLDGQVGKVHNILENEIKKYSNSENYEMALQSYKSLEVLKSITQEKREISSYVENPNFLEDIRTEELNGLRKLLDKHLRLDSLNRIECFDIAHIAGFFPTASMVTFIDGEPSKNYYRHFKINQKNKNNDVDSMRLVLARRKKHINDWGKPDLIIVDGGKGQVSAALEVFHGEFPVIGLAKRLETLIIKTDDGFVEITPHGPALRLVQRLRDEAHRFARRYHHKLVSKAIIGGGRI